MRKITSKVIVQQPVEREIATGVTIDLTIEEYAVLRIILGRIGGNPNDTLRGYAESLSNKLRGDTNTGTPHDLDLQWNNEWTNHDKLFNNQPRSSIIFAEGSKHSPFFRKIVNYYKENL